jgi:LacI family transcriptional regulator
MMQVSIKDIADHLGLSKMTVSRALAGKDCVNEGTRRRIVAYAEEIGYRTNRAAQALATGQSRLVLLWVDRTHVPFYAKVIHHVQRHARAHGYQVIIGETAPGGGNADAPGEGAEAEALANSWPIDGVLSVDNPVFVAALRDSGRRVPLVNLGAFAVPGVDYVGVDLGAGAREAVRHLISGGRRRIAYLLHAHAYREGDARYDGYHAALAEAGLTPEYIIVREGTRAAARTAVAEHVARQGRPDAIFCRDDLLAIGAYRGLRDRGVCVGRAGVALVGCDGIEEAEFMEPTLSTIVQPVEEMCARGWKFLERRMQEHNSRGTDRTTPGPPPRTIILQPKLEIRESS